MRILRIKIFSDSKKQQKKENLFPGQEIVGVGGIAAGGKLLDNVHKSGEISGRVHLYHGTSKIAGKKIKEEGLKKSHALDEGTITRTAGITPRELVYTAKKRRVGLSHSVAAIMNNDTPELIRMSIPYDEYKKMKKSTDNPEMAGAKSAKEYAKLIKEGKTPNPNDEMVTRASESMGKKAGEKYIDHYARKKWDNLSGAEGTSGTRIFEQDINPERIKGSKHYKRNSAKEISGYIKRNPKRFLKGVGKGAAATALIVGGAKLTTAKKKKKDKKN